jgi:ketosteroid isomerase-like protein
MPLAKASATGGDAIREEWAHNFGIPGFSNAAPIAALDVSLYGTMGVTRGTYAATMNAPDGESIVERGKWVSAWRRAAGGPWRITIDI